MCQTPYLRWKVLNPYVDRPRSVYAREAVMGLVRNSSRIAILVASVLVAATPCISEDSGASTEAWTISVTGADGRPVRCAKARVYEHARGWRPGSVHTVASGQVKVPFPLGGMAAVVEIWEAKDIAREIQGGAKLVGPVIPTRSSLVIHLPRPRTIVGRVLGPGGKPIGGVAFSATCSPQGWGGGVIRPESLRHCVARSDDTGKVELAGLGPYTYAVHAAPEAPWIPPGALAVSEDPAPFTLRLVKGRTAVIRVLDPGGMCVPGASVRAEWPSWSADAGADGVPRIGTRRTASTGASTGPDGRVSLGGLPSGRGVDLFVDPPDTSALAPARRLNWAGEEVVVRLEREHVLRGRVVDSQGAPLSDVWVGLDLEGDDSVSFIGDRTDSSGIFVIRSAATPRGARAFVATTAGSATRRYAETSVVQQEDRLELIVPAAAVLRVTAKAGATEDTRVVVAREEGPVEVHWSLLGASGEVAFVGLDPGAPYTLYAGPRGRSEMAWLTGVRTGEGPVRLEFKSGAPIRGTLSSGGSAVPCFFLDLEVLAICRRLPLEVSVDEAQNFVTPPLPQGTSWNFVYASPPGVAPRVLGNATAGATERVTLRGE